MSDNYLINTAEQIYNDNLNTIIMKKLYKNNILTKDDFEQAKNNTIKNIEVLKNVILYQSSDDLKISKNDMAIFDHINEIVDDIHTENLKNLA